MNSIAQSFGARLESSLPLFLLAVLAGVGIFILFVGLFAPPRGRPKEMKAAARQMQFTSIRTRLKRAQIDISPNEFVKRSLTLGIPLGLGMFILIGSVVLIGVGIIAGFLFTWTALEQERDRKQIRYTKLLASACDTIRTAYGVNPSLKKAMEAVAEYSQSPVREDFQEILVAASQERFVEGLQEIGERRRSIVYDTVATSLIRASEASGEVGDMLERLAESTRQNVSAFEDAISSQINARSGIQWGTYGPWVIFCVFRVMSLMFSSSAGANVFAPMVGFFATPGGNILALLAATITIMVYRQCNSIAQRGLVVKRVSMVQATQAGPKVGQKPISGQRSDSAYNAQSRPVTVN